MGLSTADGLKDKWYCICCTSATCRVLGERYHLTLPERPDLTFFDNPISSPPPPQPHMSRRESRPAATAPLATSNILSSPPVIESPLFDQVREQIYSEVDTLVSENESRPNYLMELLRAVQLLNTDYLRQTGLNSLKRVINNYLNPDQIDPQALSSFPAPPYPFLPDTQLVQDEDVYSPTQNFIKSLKDSH